MRVIRFFPRKTNATPDDDLVRFGPPSLFDEADEVHVSVTFSWDLPLAEKLVRQWSPVARVSTIAARQKWKLGSVDREVS